MRFLALAVLSLVFLFPPVAWADQTLTFFTIASGTQSGVRTRTQVVIHTPTEWQVLWRKHAAGLPGTSVVPKVDFSRDMVIAVFAGEATVDTRVSVVKIVQQQGRLVVLVRITAVQPGPARTDAAPASPFLVVRLARVMLPVVFRDTTVRDIY